MAKIWMISPSSFRTNEPYSNNMINVKVYFSGDPIKSLSNHVFHIRLGRNATIKDVQNKLLQYPEFIKNGLDDYEFRGQGFGGPIDLNEGNTLKSIVDEENMAKIWMISP